MQKLTVNVLLVSVDFDQQEIKLNNCCQNLKWKHAASRGYTFKQVAFNICLMVYLKLYLFNIKTKEESCTYRTKSWKTMLGNISLGR